MFTFQRVEMSLLLAVFLNYSFFLPCHYLRSQLNSNYKLQDYFDLWTQALASPPFQYLLLCSEKSAGLAVSLSN